MTSFTVIIPTYNRNESLSKCINSIVSQGVNPTPAIVIVDDGSDSINAAANKQLCKKYKLNYIYNEIQSGPAAARNRGVSQAQSEWIVFIDDDVIVCTDWSRLMNSKLSECPVSCVGLEGRVEPSGAGLWDQEVQNRSGGSYLSCHLAYRSDIFKAENGFDTQFKGPYCEDHELAARMLCHGEIRFDTELYVTHQPRNIRRIKHLSSSLKRTMLLLDSELHFFSKHPARYHQFRKSRTFTGTLISNIFLLMYQDIKRRSQSQILHNIPDMLTLLLSSIFEQIGSLIWLINNFLTISQKQTFFGSTVNLQETGRVWLITNCDTKYFTMHKQFFNALTFKFRKKPVYNAFRIHQKLSRISQHTGAQIFIRIDDLFFDDLQKVTLFITRIHTLKLPVMVALRGDDIQNPAYLPFLKALKTAGIFIGIHGFSHTGRYGPFDSELLQMCYGVFEQQISPVIQILSSLGQKHSIFVPPFNAISGEQIKRWSKVCSIICGGPETARFTDQLYGPVAISDAGWYFPSIQPFYGDARTMLYNNVLSMITSLKGPLCLTTHFTQELNDNFDSLTKLLERIHSCISRWEETHSW